MTPGRMILGRITLDRITLGRITLGRMTLGRMTFNIKDSRQADTHHNHIKHLRITVFKQNSV
jgi:hypothetical protein